MDRRAYYSIVRSANTSTLAKNPDAQNAMRNWMIQTEQQMLNSNFISSPNNLIGTCLLQPHSISLIFIRVSRQHLSAANKDEDHTHNERFIIRLPQLLKSKKGSIQVDLKLRIPIGL